MSHVFVSYSKKNKDYVLKLVDKLLDEGFDVWIDNRRLRSSEDWWRSIVEALRDCSAFVVVLTPESDVSEWVQLEITLAMKYKKARFPIFLSGTMDTPNWAIFARTQYVDATSGQLPPPDFFDTLGEHARRKSFRGTTVTATGRLDRKIGQMLEDDPILKEAMDTPPRDNEDEEDTQVISRPIRSNNLPRSRGMAIGIVALVIVILAVLFFVVTSNLNKAVAITATPTISSTATLTPQTPTTSPELNLSTTRATIESLNAWRVQNGYTPLKQDSTLNELTNRQRSYLMSLSLTDFNALDSLYRDRDGRDAQEMAAAMGYKGEVQMIVEVTSSDVMLDDVLDKIETSGDSDVHSRFHEIGLDVQKSVIIDPAKVFFVLILGTGAPS